MDWLGSTKGVGAVFCAFTLFFGLLASLYTSFIEHT